MLEIILFTIFLATFLNLFLKRFGIPTIIGYIITGTIIAYSFNLHSAVNNHDLKIIAEFGIVFLMFTIGLEFSIKHLEKMKKEVFIYGTSQVLFTALVFMLLSIYFFDINLKTSIIIALALALSSTAIVLKTLNENGHINRLYGKRVLGVLLFQDIAVIPILLMITIFSMENQTISSLLMETIIDAIILFIGLFIVGKYLLDGFFYQVAKSKSNEIFISSILLFVIGISYLAHYLGFSYSLGAFVAGMMIAETKYKHQVEADLIPFRDLLLGVFFVTVGMQLDFKLILENIKIIALLLPVLISIKILILFIIMRFTSSTKTSLKAAISLFQLGEFALVIFELSFAKGLIEAYLVQILIVTIVLTMVMTPFILKNISTISDFICKSKNQKIKNISQKEELNNHYILVGYGRLGKSISKLLDEKGEKYVAVEGDIKTVLDAQKQNKPVIYGNASKKDILKSLNIHKAKAIIVSIGNSKKLHHVCEVVNEMAEGKKVVVKVNSYEERTSLSSLNLSHIIVETEKTAKAMFFEASLINEDLKT